MRAFFLFSVPLLLVLAPASAGAQTLLRDDGSFGRFAEPAGVATDDGGRVYVADAGGGRVDVFDSASDGNRQPHPDDPLPRRVRKRFEYQFATSHALIPSEHPDSRIFRPPVKRK